MSRQIIVGMSGGVDSSVAALLLKRQGYDVLGVFMKNWEEQDEDGVCTSEEDYRDVRAVCDHIGIPYYTVNFTKEYWDRVFSYFLEEYKRGRTPNPDVLCNREIKFRAFLDYARKNGIDTIATGHFVKSRHNGSSVELLRGTDPNKDQSYFLYMLSQEQMGSAVFPVGGMTKAQVREIAREAGLPTARKKDSTGVCFIGERDFKRFLQTYLPAQPGDMVSPEGKVVGRHDGLMYYTLGQRKGLGIGGSGDGRAWFVIGKDLENNILHVAQGEDHPALYANYVSADQIHWIDGVDRQDMRCSAKIRYRAPDAPCRIVRNGPDLGVYFESPVRGVAPGQSIVFYDGEVCLGGAIMNTANFLGKNENRY